MANSDNTGQDRVRRMEQNNRSGEKATGLGTKTPRKDGAKKGFGSNKIKSRQGIMGKPRA
jgi:hypothetical protein